MNQSINLILISKKKFQNPTEGLFSCRIDLISFKIVLLIIDLIKSILLTSILIPCNSKNFFLNEYSNWVEKIFEKIKFIVFHQF